MWLDRLLSVLRCELRFNRFVTHGATAPPARLFFYPVTVTSREALVSDTSISSGLSAPFATTVSTHAWSSGCRPKGRIAMAKILIQLAWGGSLNGFGTRIFKRFWGNSSVQPKSRTPALQGPPCSPPTPACGSPPLLIPARLGMGYLSPAQPPAYFFSPLGFARCLA